MNALLGKEQNAEAEEFHQCVCVNGWIELPQSRMLTIETDRIRQWDPMGTWRRWEKVEDSANVGVPSAPGAVRMRRCGAGGKVRWSWRTAVGMWESPRPHGCAALSHPAATAAASLRRGHRRWASQEWAPVHYTWLQHTPLTDVFLKTTKDIFTRGEHVPTNSTERYKDPWL